MCGIVGYVGPRKVVPVIIEGCAASNIAATTQQVSPSAVPRAPRLKCAARRKLANLEEVLREHPVEGTFGIGHTRWPRTPPHRRERPPAPRLHRPHRRRAQRNRRKLPRLEAELTEQGHVFVTETDTEVIAHLIEQVQKDAAAAGAPSCLKPLYASPSSACAAPLLSHSLRRRARQIIAARSGPPWSSRG